MAYEINTLVEGNGRIVLSAKTGKTGSFARAIAFASRDTRLAMGQALYVKWLANGQFRPLVQDVIDVLVPKSAQPFVTGLVPAVGPIPKPALVALCSAVVNAVESKGKELKGQKSFVYEFVRRIAEGEKAGEVIDAA